MGCTLLNLARTIGKNVSGTIDLLSCNIKCGYFLGAISKQISTRLVFDSTQKYKLKTKFKRIFNF